MSTTRPDDWRKPTAARSAAIKQYTRALEEDPKHIPSLISLARLHDRQNNFDEAQRLYRRAIAAEPENAMAYNDLGLCLGRNDRGEESIEALRQAIKLEPNRKLYRNNLATVLVELGRIDEAWNELNSVHTAAVAHYNLGFLLYQKGDMQAARRRFALACANDSSLSAAKDMLAQLNEQPTQQSAPSGKVRYRVEDMIVGPATVLTSNGPPTKPVAMVHSPRELRRIPPTELTPPRDAATPPSVHCTNRS